jgi:hypothetical protein
VKDEPELGFGALEGVLRIPAMPVVHLTVLVSLDCLDGAQSQAHTEGSHLSQEWCTPTHAAVNAIPAILS